MLIRKPGRSLLKAPFDCKRTNKAYTTYYFKLIPHCALFILQQALTGLVVTKLGIYLEPFTRFWNLLLTLEKLR